MKVKSFQKFLLENHFIDATTLYNELKHKNKTDVVKKLNDLVSGKLVLITMKPHEMPFRIFVDEVKLDKGKLFLSGTNKFNKQVAYELSPTGQITLI